MRRIQLPEEPTNRVNCNWGCPKQTATHGSPYSRSVYFPSTKVSLILREELCLKLLIHEPTPFWSFTHTLWGSDNGWGLASYGQTWFLGPPGGWHVTGTNGVPTSTTAPPVQPLGATDACDSPVVVTGFCHSSGIRRTHTIPGAHPSLWAMSHLLSEVPAKSGLWTGLSCTSQLLAGDLSPASLWNMETLLCVPGRGLSPCSWDAAFTLKTVQRVLGTQMEPNQPQIWSKCESWKMWVCLLFFTSDRPFWRGRVLCLTEFVSMCIKMRPTRFNV